MEEDTIEKIHRTTDIVRMKPFWFWTEIPKQNSGCMGIFLRRSFYPEFSPQNLMQNVFV